jgi:N-acetylmuramoyl-L-alanine amidase
MSPKTVHGMAIVGLAGRHIGERYVLGALAPKDNSQWTGPWDCAEFASWLTFQVSSTLYGCHRDTDDPSVADAYTGYWARDAKALGIQISMEQAARTPGAAVLRVPQAGATGHIVISDGKGGTIEAHSTKRGVIASTLTGRRWDMGILVPGLSYEENATTPVVQPPATTIYRLTDPNMTGPTVKKIQRALNAAGFHCGRADGEFGPHTQAAVVAFQLSSGLVGDGEFGLLAAKRLGVALEAP